MTIQDWIQLYPKIPPYFEEVGYHKMIYVKAEDGVFALRTPPDSSEPVYEKTDAAFRFSSHSSWFRVDIRETPFPPKHPVKFEYWNNGGFLAGSGGTIRVAPDGRWRLDMTPIS